MTHSTSWRLTPAAWGTIAIAVVAEATSNALRAYGLGMHLEQFTVEIQGLKVSLAGAVLVLAAVAVSLSQARAAWVLFSPGRPVGQRIVAGLAAPLLLAVSIAALASHILEAQRAKGGDETGAGAAYIAKKAAYDREVAELGTMAAVRSTTEIRAAMDKVRVAPKIWDASKQCTDADLLKGPENYKACRPILDLRQEMAASIRKAELEGKVAEGAAALATMKPPTSAPTVLEAWVASHWAWIMGLAVVFVATFGPVIFATAVPITAVPVPVALVATQAPRLPASESIRREAALADLRVLLKAGQVPESQDWLADRWGIQKSTASKWLARWEASGELPGTRVMDGRTKTIVP